MNLLEARVVFRDRSVSDVLDLALRFVAVHAWTYVKVAAWSLLPFLAIALGAGRLLGWPLAWAVALPLAVVLEVPFTVLASRLVFEDDIRARDVLARAVREIPRVLVARVIALVAIVVGFACLVLPGFWIASVLLFVSEAMLLEQAGIAQAITRAQRVAASAVSEVLVGLLVLSLVPILAVLLADVGGRTLLGELLQFRPPRPVWTEYGGALATTGLFLQVPYLATARFFLYLNVRSRTEGWDIQTRFAVLGARPDVDDTPDTHGAPHGTEAA